MFARKKKNASGSISVQLVSKKRGQYRVIKTFGSSKDPDQIEQLFQQAELAAHPPDPGQQKIVKTKSQIEITEDNFAANLAQASIKLVGPELIFGTLFDRLGFNNIPDQLFRHLVITRLVYPVSKLKTIDYLKRYQGESWSVSALYSALDRLRSHYQEQVEAITYANTRRHLKNITVIFYDMTTLYFEAEDEDDLRKIGFSKDGKFQQPQIMVGLLTGEYGLPLGYDIFAGNTAETTTLIPILENIEKKYQLGKPVVIADSALLSKDNLAKLSEHGYRFILGGRIKNESENMKQEILIKAGSMQDHQGFSLSRPDGTRLIVTYSAKRARKDNHNRERGLKRLKQRVKVGALTKASINSRGYNKFLKLDGKVMVTLDEDKIKSDAKWDGLKGYITNTKFKYQKVVANYAHLWQIEKAFRISKTDLRIRPIYHYRKRRIEAHICISFVAYSIYQEMDLLLKEKNISMTAGRATELAQNIYELHYQVPSSGRWRKQLLKLDSEQEILLAAVRG